MVYAQYVADLACFTLEKVGGVNVCVALPGLQSAGHRSPDQHGVNPDVTTQLQGQFGYGLLPRSIDVYAHSTNVK